MNIFKLHYKMMSLSLLLISHSVSVGMQRQSEQKNKPEWNKNIVPLTRYSLDYIPREMQVPIFRQSGLSFDDKKNLSLVNKASHKNIRENILLYQPIPSSKMIFAIDATMYVTDIAKNTISCSII